MAVSQNYLSGRVILSGAAAALFAAAVESKDPTWDGNGTSAGRLSGRDGDIAPTVLAEKPAHCIFTASICGILLPLRGTQDDLSWRVG